MGHFQIFLHENASLECARLAAQVMCRVGRVGILDVICFQNNFAECKEEKQNVIVELLSLNNEMKIRLRLTTQPCLCTASNSNLARLYKQVN